ncbi:M23 family metallopeptidase [Cupriavidus taiwanensis]|uniref:M23 family metallopeptidase n=1 Tax=Cupriavidus taiwanensis TaxID=164546 RepID=UPI000E102D8F|nr:M23 family metallopeptidase [Cupriavidus taiwanensis]SOY64709.1 putative metalloendopeptidase, M23 family [Cupriavidus taiwanensis]SOY64940.1 putative metalloendopeptidase, M23 family [Cupriavidus taiwanensis]SOY94092.1 putative metalloendopeptidase, M23 family [Cupriavidus taiwanensis]SOZ27256.1 putative metalloendopeptidase, M23 family [Cupriavidus taiwanensis]SOZ69303.1 putative metalloendopeptidase, M23 family [Cupriavidus taiwanensis]
MAASRLVPPLLALVRRLAWLALWIGLSCLAWPWLQPPLERAIYAARLSARPAPAALPVPVAGVGPRALRDTWHGARAGGRKHEGIDIFAPRGREVVSATEGIVTRVGTNQLGGNVVWVMGPGRQMHYYAHLDRYAGVRAGDIIAAGTVLGYVGTTGNARGTPPHLHYGIYTAGGAINPYPLLTPTVAAGAH